MKIIECVQKTPEWYSARCGMPTASSFDKIITSEGKQSKQRTKYIYQVAGESITGVPEETYQSGAMLRGVEMEAEARAYYSLVNDTDIQQVGFCISEDIQCGASPDGLIGERGLIEIKCPNLATHVGYLLEGKLPTDYFQQVHGELFVTDRDWCDFVSYYPGIRPFILRVKRDDVFIEQLSKELKLFCQELNLVIGKIK